MDLSIVSGTYNRLLYLQKMVLSVRDSIKHIYGFQHEIVLVDGGSNDGTQEWCNQQPDIKLIQHDKLYGAVKAFNDGAFAATGKYVIMANDDIEFVGNSIWLAYIYMETHPNCGGGCFWQDRNNRDWHVNGMQAVRKIGNKAEQVHAYYAQVGIFHKWLGDKVNWWCDQDEYSLYLGKKAIQTVNGQIVIGLHTYGGDNELSARIWDLGYTIDPIGSKEFGGRITDKEAQDNLREINNVTGGSDPRAVRGEHPDSNMFGQKWINRNVRLNIRYPGPIIKDKPMISNPNPIEAKERILYLPLFEQGWQVQKEQKRGLRDALAKVGIVYEFDYMQVIANVGKSAMLASLIEICNEFQPTIFLSQLHNSDQINTKMIAEIKRNCLSNTKFINWNGDYWPDQLLDDKGLALARSFDLMTTVNRDVMEKHQVQGINTQYWQIGWEPDGRGYEPNIYHDIVFLASGYSSKRQELGKFLASQPYSLGLYGSGWPDGASKGQNLYNFKEACKIYRGAKIAIGDSQWPESGFVSNRIMQILAAGNCVLVHQWFRDYEQLGLVDKVNCLVWKDLAELKKILRFWLFDSNSQELSEIAAEGEKLALASHSFESRVNELWQMLGIGQEAQESWRW